MGRDYTVYIHKTPSGKVYIGQTRQPLGKRWGKDGTGYQDNSYFFNAIKKYGWNDIEHIIVQTNLTHDEADVLEKDLILKYDSTNPDHGYNFQLGGHNGQVHTKEIKTRISNSMKKKWNGHFSDEHRIAISEGKKRSGTSEKALTSALNNLSKAHSVPRDEKYKQKMSEVKKGCKGRQWTDEDRRKHSERMKQVYGAK